jgi:hypothetical protein
MDLGTWISVVALLISGLSLAISFWNNRRSAITGRKPVLAFVYDHESGWLLQNIGNGPALNVIVAQKEVGGQWFNPVRVPPVSKDGTFVCRWLGHVNTTGLGATYTDFEGRPYSSVSGNDLSRTFEGHKLPVWEESEVGRHWDHPIYRND